MAVQISVIVPVKDEEENVAALAREIAAALKGEGEAEIIFVDDGSSDRTKERLVELKREIPNLRVLAHARNLGQSRATMTGARAAKGDILVTLDGDGQNDPADIPKLTAILKADTAKKIGLVGGVRTKRQDSWSKRLASRVGNGVRRWLLNDQATDTGCALKAMRREPFLTLPYFDHMHRYFIALMLREGYEARFVPVNHRHRQHGVSKYRVIDRLLVSIADLQGVMWLNRRHRGPADIKEL